MVWANNYDFPKLEEGIVIRETLPDGNIATGQSFAINLRRPAIRGPEGPRSDCADV